MLLMTYGNYPKHEKIKKILIVKLRHLGDVLLTTPVFPNIKKVMPKVTLDVLVNKEATPILKNNPYVDNLIVFDRSIKKKKIYSKLKNELLFYLSIWKKKYDLVINLTDGDRALFITKISKAKTSVGMQCDNNKINNHYTYLVKKCHLERHVVEKNLDAIRRIGIFPEFNDRNLDFFYEIPKQSSSLVKLLNQIDGGYILIHPTSRWKFKCWTNKNVSTLIRRLQEDNKTIVLTSGPSKDEKSMIEKIIANVDGSKVINLSGMISIDELAYLIHKCMALVCVDSFPFHIASCFKKPTVALFGPTSDVTWGAWKNPNAEIVKFKTSCMPCFLDGCGGSKMSDCLSRITVDQVMSALTRVVGCQSPLKTLSHHL